MGSVGREQVHFNTSFQCLSPKAACCFSAKQGQTWQTLGSSQLTEITPSETGDGDGRWEGSGSLASGGFYPCWHDTPPPPGTSVVWLFWFIAQVMPQSTTHLLTDEPLFKSQNIRRINWCNAYIQHVKYWSRPRLDWKGIFYCGIQNN